MIQSWGAMLAPKILLSITVFHVLHYMASCPSDCATKSAFGDIRHVARGRFTPRLLSVLGSEPVKGHSSI